MSSTEGPPPSPDPRRVLAASEGQPATPFQPPPPDEGDGGGLGRANKEGAEAPPAQACGQPRDFPRPRQEAPVCVLLDVYFDRRIHAGLGACKSFDDHRRSSEPPHVFCKAEGVREVFRHLRAGLRHDEH